MSTEKLFHVTPVLTWVTSTLAIETIEKELGVPVKYLSSGPTAADKQIRERQNEHHSKR